MTKMHLMWFCAFSPHAGFGLDGWAGPRTTGYEWTRPERETSELKNLVK
jgi:hypothetical protein